jgi:Tol biopolymer transport system component
MNDRSHRDDSIEDRLDRLIDALNAGLTPATPDDPELAGLAEAVRSADSVRETQWPDARFPRRMAARLSSELRMTSQFARQSADTNVIDASDLPPSVNGVSRAMTASEEFDLTVPRRHSRLRTFAQMAAGFAGFALLTAVLVIAFRGASDNPSLGGAPDDEAGQIAFVKSVDGNAEIFLANADGSEQTNLTNDPANDAMPAWSPDGTQIAFVSDRVGSDALYVMRADGSDVQEIFSPSLADGSRLGNVKWSPTGSLIAVMRFEPSEGAGASGIRSSIIVVPSNGGSHRVLSSGAAFDQPPAWSADGKWLAFAAGWDAREGGYLYLADPTKPENNQESNLVHPVNSADGHWLEGVDISWSNNGEMAMAQGGGIAIAKQIVEPDQFEIVEQFSVAETAKVRRVRWSPDGNHVAVSLSTQTLWLVNRDGTNLVEIPDTVFGTYPEWQPYSAWSPDPMWSPDGAYLAYHRAATSAESASYNLVVIDADDLTTMTTIDTGLSGPFLSPPAWRPVETESDDGEQAQVTATPTTENASWELIATPPSTPNASIAIVPYELNCDGSAAVVGSGFATGSTVDIFFGEEVPKAPDGSAIVSTTAGEDGSFQFEDLVPVSSLIPDCEERAADGGGQLTFSAASLIEVDGEQRYAEPAAHTPIFLTPTSDAPEQALVDQATAAAREFLSEPESTFEVLEVNQEEDPYVRISRQVGDAYDEFRYDVDRGEIASATIQSHTSTHAPVQPVDADQALEIAETTASQAHAGFDQLTLYETFDQGTIPGGDGQDQVLSATWQLKVNDQVWVPTTLQVDVDMQTGLVLGYWFTSEPYQGPLEPQVTQEDAVATAEDAIASEPTVAGASIGTAELATSYAAAEADWILVWRIHLENTPESAPSRFIEVDAITGELLTDFGEPGGQG